MVQGLRSFGSEWSHVRRLLGVVAPLIEASSARLGGRELAVAFTSMRTLGGGGDVIPSQRPSKGPIRVESSPGDVSKTSDVSPNADVNVATGEKTGRSQAEESSVLGFHTLHEGLGWRNRGGIGNGSKRKIGRRVPPGELVRLLNAMGEKLSRRRERLSPSSVGSALFGLQGISGDLNAVRRILLILCEDLRYANDRNRRLAKDGSGSMAKSDVNPLMERVSVFPFSSNARRDEIPGSADGGDSEDRRYSTSRAALPVEPGSSSYMSSQAMSNALYGTMCMHATRLICSILPSCLHCVVDVCVMSSL